MAEFESLLQEYQLDPSYTSDEGYDCIAIDVGNLSKIVSDLCEEELLRVRSASKLYVCGKWMSDFPSDPVQWREDVVKVCGLIQEMGNLEELTWVSDLPFMEMVWDTLPRTLAKLIIDVSRPVSVNYDNPMHKQYISHEQMRPLVEFTKLRELRIFGMRQTFQPTIWETVFMNNAEDKGMNVLDLQMAEKPLVRQNHWVNAKDVRGLSVSNRDGHVYRGLEGKGVLHYEYGTGEYLDDYCMRKSRIASKLDETKPLPLWCVKLDGFVIDQLPFEHELSKVVLLTCGQNCIDAGLRAPRTPKACTFNKWGPSVNNESTHCLIVWPNFSAIYDNEGNRLDANGKVVESDDNVSPQSLEPAPLTTERLNLKDLAEAIENVKRRDSKASTPGKSPTDDSTADAESGSTTNAASVMATHGSVMSASSMSSLTSQIPVDEAQSAEATKLVLPVSTDATQGSKYRNTGSASSPAA